MRELIEKLIDIQAELKVEKTKYNDFGKFNYRSCEDILKEVKPLCRKHGLLLLLVDDIYGYNEKTYVKATARITDGNEAIETTALAREPSESKAKMDASQTTGSTSSYARKMALSGLFALDDGIDSDGLNQGKDEKNSNEKLITDEQIKELKSLGFDDARLKKMAEYHKVDDIKKVTYKDADDAIQKQKRTNEKERQNI